MTLGSEENEETESSTNPAVRSAVARAVVRENPAFGPRTADALAFAAHPWPDRAVPGSILEAIASEMSTSRTLPHHDPRELAQDRLLRIAEALDEVVATNSIGWASWGDLPTIFRGVADGLNRDIQTFPLVGSKVGDHLRSVSQLIGNTTGLRSDVPPPGAGSTTRLGDLDLGNVSVASDVGADAATQLADLDGGNAPVISDAKALGFASAIVVAYVRTGHDDLGQLLGGTPTGSSALQLVESFRLGPYLFPDWGKFLQGCSDRGLAILSRRTAFPGERLSGTLEEVGDQLDVTRERVRQLEKKLLDQLHHPSWTRTNSGVFDKLANQVHRSDRLVTAAKVLTAGCPSGELVAKLLLRFEADWAWDDDYSIGAQAADQLASLKDRLAEHADENRLLTEEVVKEVVGDLFTSESARDAHLTKFGLIQICGFWGLSDVRQVRIAAALRTIGRPATKAEIGELVGLSERQVAAQAGATPGVVRADMTRWGFEEWVDDAYDGIVGEIEQRLDENNGEVRYDALIAELEQFGLKKSSINSNLQSDAYLWKDGVVRRNPTNYKPRLLADRRDVVWDNELSGDKLCGQRIVLTEQNFKGFALSIGFEIAYENGLRPNDNLMVPFEGSNGLEVSVIWRPTTLSRTMDVNRVADPLTAAGFSPGDTVLVFATPECVRVVADDAPRRSADTSGSSGSGGLLDLLGGGSD